jgi:hypothetical protein
MALHTVHVRVNDAATGQPTPVRIRFASPKGEYFAPLGRLAEFATGPNQDVGGNLRLSVKSFAYIDGSCEVLLPAGPIQVEIDKGPEYRPLHSEFTLNPGKLALRFTVQRWTDQRAERWYSADTRAHCLTPHAALLEGMAEDLAVVNVLAAEVQLPGPDNIRAIPNILAFSGQQPALARPECLVVVNTHNVHPVLGSLGLLNCHRIVYPLRFGDPGEWDDWSLADWCDQCHRKGGLVIATPAPQRNPDCPLGESLADLVLGKIDAVEITGNADWQAELLPKWYALLSTGHPVPIVGGTGKDSNRVPLGSMRTYARLNAGDDFT